MNRGCFSWMYYGWCVVFCAAVTGCLASADENEKMKAVRTVTADFYESASQADFDRFKSIVFAAKGEEDLPKAVFDYVRRSYEFRSAIVRRFGANGLKEAKSTPSGRGIEILLPPNGREWVNSLQFEFTDADTAIAFCEHTNRSIVVVRRKGKWLIDLAGDFERPLDARAIAESLYPLSRSYESGITKCKNEKSTIAEVVDAVIAELMKE